MATEKLTISVESDHGTGCLKMAFMALGALGTFLGGLGAFLALLV